MDLNFNSKLEEYYQKFIELQEKLKRSEEQRFVLEMKFNEMVHVAKEEEQAHFRKLRSQYKKFLEEDRKRQERNERIIRNLERIETKISMLSAKTDRISMFRRQYQSYLRRMIANRNVEMKTPESRISRERSFIKEEPFRNQQPKLFRDDYSIPEKPKETIEEDKPFYAHPTVQKALEKDRSNEEKIEILDRYLQSMSTPRCRDILDHERQARENLSGNIPSNIYYKDDFSSNATNQAAAVADDIMNSIYSRYYSRPDMVPKENKDLEEGTTQRCDRYLNQDKGFNTEKHTPSVSFNPNAYVLNDNKNVNHKNEDELFDADTPKNKSNESISSFNTNLLLNLNKDQNAVKTIIDNSPIIKQEINNVDEFNGILNNTDSICREINQFNLDSGQKTNTPFNFSSSSTENEAKPETVDRIDTKLTDKLTNGLVTDIPTVYENVKQNENKFASMSNSNIDKSHLEIACAKEENQQLFIQEELQRNGQPKEQPQDQFSININKNQTEKNKSVENKEENHSLLDQPYPDHRQNNNYDQPQEQFREDIIKNQPDQIQSVENKEDNQVLVQQPYLDHRQNGNDESNIDVQQKILKERDHSSVKHNQNNHPTKLDVKSEQPICFEDNELPFNDQNLEVIPSDPNPPMQEYDASHRLSAQLNEMAPPQGYGENDPYQEIQYDEHGQPIQYDQKIQYDEHGQPIQYDQKVQYDEHGQPIQYDQNIQPTDYDQYGEFLLYDENGHVVQPVYDENGQILPQYDVNGQIIMLYDQNGQPFFTDQYKSDQQQYDENGQPLLQYDENGQPVMQYDENGQPIYDQNQYYDYTNQGQTNIPNEYDEGKSEDQGPYHDTENVKHKNQIENSGLNNQKSNLDMDVGELNDQTVNAGYKNQNDDVVLGDQEPYHDTEDGVANDDVDIVDPYKGISRDSSSPKNKTDQSQPPNKDSHQLDTDKSPDVKTINNDVNSKMDKVQVQNENQEGVKDTVSNKPIQPTNVMDILDTDTESVKQNTSKVSNDSDFDFS